VDTHTHLLAFTRMDGAKITSINTAMDMASSAAGNRIPTSAYQESSWASSAPSGMGNATAQRFCALGGGVPIIDDEGQILGAIGCSTGMSMQDEDAARAGRDAVMELIRRENEDEAGRLADERQAVLSLWKEKEDEVDALRCELQRGNKRMRLSDAGLAGLGVNNPPDTPPDDVEVHPGFVGEVVLGTFE
jgi:uncharacterized protein GlcG (DUF336 family)